MQNEKAYELQSPQVRRCTGIPCAMVYDLFRDLPGETGLFCHRCFSEDREAWHLHRGAGTTRLYFQTAI